MDTFKRSVDSATTQIQILMQKDMNGNKRLFGGRLMEWIDIVAAVTARRHSNTEVTTVSIDYLHFKSPAYLNNTLLISGKITYIGNSSMEVKVETFVEKIDGNRFHINTAYIVLVAIDENEKPIRVPRLILDTEEEKTEWERGKKRNELRKSRNKEMY